MLDIPARSPLADIAHASAGANGSISLTGYGSIRATIC